MIVRVALALVAVVLAIAPLPAAAQTSTPAPISANRIDALRPEFRKAFVEVSGPYIAELIAAFPDEYRAFETEILTAHLQGVLTAKLAREMGFNFTSGLTDRAYDGWRMAPDESLATVLSSEITSSRMLRDIKPAACAALAAGASSPDLAAGIPAEKLRTLNDSNLQMLRAGKAGRAARITRPPPTDAELSRVIGRYEKAGGDDRWLGGKASPGFATMTPAETCDSYILWLESVQAEPRDVAARFLARQ